MKLLIAHLLAWLAVWIAGCLVFDGWLNLTGSWLMFGGAVTYMVCERLTAPLRSNVGIKPGHEVTSA